MNFILANIKRILITYLEPEVNRIHKTKVCKPSFDLVRNTGAVLNTPQVDLSLNVSQLMRLFEAATFSYSIVVGNERAVSMAVVNFSTNVLFSFSLQFIGIKVI